MITKKSTIPENAVVRRFLPADYDDTFVCLLDGKWEVSPDDVLTAFWTDWPWWAAGLMKLRNLLVRPFGLKGDNEGVHFDELGKAIREGSSAGMSSIVAKTPDETVMLMSDSHLDAYISVRVEAGQKETRVYAVTLVKFNKKLGNIYFFAIKPFHRVIVKSLMKRVVVKVAAPA